MIKTVLKVYSYQYDTYFYYIRNINFISQCSKYISQYFNNDFNNEALKIRGFLKDNLKLISSKEKLNLFNSMIPEYKIEKNSIDLDLYKKLHLIIYNDKKEIKNVKLDFSKQWNLKKIFKRLSTESAFIKKIENVLFEFLSSPENKEIKKLYTFEINDDYKISIEFL